MPDRLLERLASRGTVVCPTLGKAAGSTPPAAVLAIMQRTGMTWEARQAHAAHKQMAAVAAVSASSKRGWNAGWHGARAAIAAR